MIDLLALTVVVAFAGYRLARAVAVDDITQPFRARLYEWTYTSRLKPPTRFRQFVFDLLTCPLCVGFWITLVIGLVASTQLSDAPPVQHLLLAVSATGGQCLLAIRETSR